MSKIYKPKKSKVYEEIKATIVAEPWLTYREVAELMTSPCALSTVQVYGTNVRKEVGAVLVSRDGKEVLSVDWEKYSAQPGAMTAREELIARSSRVVVFKESKELLIDEIQPTPKEVVDAAMDMFVQSDPKDIGAILAERLAYAELRCTEANLEVHELTHKLSEAKVKAAEAAEALKFLDSLAASPPSVIKAILG